MRQQLQFFSRGELAAMRDRTASRNYSPERDQFRRDHERHRRWGLTQRHARRLRQLRDQHDDHAAPDPTEPHTTNPPPTRATGPIHIEQTSPDHTLPTNHDPSQRSNQPRTALAGLAEPAQEHHPDRDASQREPAGAHALGEIAGQPEPTRAHAL
ncbi:hypothetical protein, partial [Actinoplanes sp. NPDC005259]|uniref:hypothetical protein n=1 Tax=Actinoplanes sp. NPDC005259 TaxID=3154674 RepID=UPI0033BC7DC4